LRDSCGNDFDLAQRLKAGHYLGEGTHQQQDFHHRKFEELMAWSPNNCLTDQKYASVGPAANWQK